MVGYIPLNPHRSIQTRSQYTAFRPGHLHYPVVATTPRGHYHLLFDGDHSPWSVLVFCHTLSGHDYRIRYELLNSPISYPEDAVRIDMKKLHLHSSAASQHSPNPFRKCCSLYKTNASSRCGYTVTCRRLSHSSLFALRTEPLLRCWDRIQRRS